jgi:hypothetical protein
MDISKFDYVAKPAEIAKLTVELLEAETTVSEGRTTYLRALVDTTKEELPKDGKPDKATALGALEAVHTRFYEAVTKAVQSALPPRLADRAKVLNRKTNFARTSYSAVRAWVKAGGNLATLKARHVTKAALAVPRKARPMNATRLMKRLEKRSKALMADVLALVETDKDAAVHELETLTGQFAAQLEHLGIHATRMRGGKMFIPLTATQTIRQQASPS